MTTELLKLLKVLNRMEKNTSGETLELTRQAQAEVRAWIKELCTN